MPDSKTLHPSTMQAAALARAETQRAAVEALPGIRAAALAKGSPLTQAEVLRLIGRANKQSALFQAVRRLIADGNAPGLRITSNCWVQIEACPLPGEA